MCILATYLRVCVASSQPLLCVLLTISAACNCPRAIDKFTNTLPQSAFLFPLIPPPCFYFFAIPAASSLHFMLIFGLGLRFLGFWVSSVSRFGNCKALSAVAFVNAKFCVCSAQIMQLICAQLQALCTHVSQPLLTFDSLLHF